MREKVRERAPYNKLKELAQQIRKETVQLFINYGYGHYGGSLSCVEIITALYFNILNINAEDPQWEDRDRFVLSKGHAGAVLYLALAYLGFISMDELIATYKRKKSRFGIHPDMRKIPGIEMSTGSLGHGISVAVGMALGAKCDNRQYRIFTLLGDGECHEGLVWEAAMAASHHRLDNLTAIIDLNGMTIDGPIEQITAIEPIREKWEAFGWSVTEIDGHNLEQIVSSLESVPYHRNIPTVVLARTIKGKGISFMENQHQWHSGSLTPEQLEKVRSELQII